MVFLASCCPSCLEQVLQTQTACCAVQAHEALQVLRGNIRVLVRVRPELGGVADSVLAMPMPGAVVVSPPERRVAEFEFDTVLGPDSSQVTFWLLFANNVKTTKRTF